VTTATISARRSILGCPIDALDMVDTVSRCDELIRRGGTHQHMAVNVAKLVAARENAELRSAIERSAVVNADGQGIVLAARVLGQPLPERVAGIDLMQELIALAERRGYRVFVLGARREVLDRAVAVLTERHPALCWAGTRDGYFDASEEPEVCAEIRRARPDILFVAMGTPRKETFLAANAEALGAPLLVGVGGAVDVIAGMTRRAPATWQRLGLEWLFRLLQEPRRMLRRYAVSNARFAVILGGAVARQWMGRLRSPAEAS
jgi:N-acetylglucosaminyldiphosphoundecaprenol N-acetyl-beta-D-mannosaminyltransferase